MDNGHASHLLEIFKDFTPDSIEPACRVVRLLADASPLAIVLLDRDCHVRLWSHAAEEIFGWREEEVLGGPLPIITEGDAGEYHAMVQEELAGASRTKVQQKRRTKYNGDVHVSLWTAPVHNARGNILGTLKMFSNPVQRRRAEEALRRERDFAQNLIRLAPSIVLVLDTEGRIVQFNPFLEQLTGYRLEEIRGRFCFDFVPVREQAGVQDVFSRIIEKGEQTTHINSIIAKDGHECLIEWHACVLFDDAGQPSGVLTIGLDISNQHAAQEALRESEEKYRHLFELESDAIFLIDNETGQIIDANEAATRIYGYTHEELLRRRNVDMSAEPDATRKATAEGLHKIPIRYHRKKDGTVFPVEITATHFTFKNRPVHAAAIRDISQRLSAQDEIQQQKDFLQRIIDLTPNFVYVLDKKARIILTNRNMEIDLGISREELIGKTALETVCDPESAAANYQEDLEILGGRLPKVEKEMTFVDPQGRKHWQQLVKLPMFGASGEVSQILCVGHDVTKRKEAELALRESEERFVQFMGNIPAAVFITDRDGRLIYINEFFKRMFELPDNWLGMRQEDHFPPDLARRLHEIDNETFEKDLAVFTETLSREDGSECFLKTHRFAIRRPGKPVLLGGIAMDITDLKKSEEERAKLEEQLLQALKMEAVGRLAGGVAHDFNNLLSPILGYADLVMSRLNESDSLYSDVMQIRLAAERGASLTRQLLAFSRKQVLETRPVSLNQIVSEFSSMLRRLIGEDIHLETSLPEDIGRVKADASQIQQILMNLAVNARDAMPAGGTLRIETANVALDEAYAQVHPDVAPGEYVQLSVADTGSGMPAEVLTHIFEPFFTTKETGKGTGLGLSSVYGLVRQHGAHITVYSEDGQGTCFRINFPRIESPTGYSEEKPKPAAAAAVGGHETILVVEDEELVRKLAVSLLAAHGYKVLVASNPDEAMAVQAQYEGAIDLLLTDIIMPGRNGRDLYLEVSKVRPDIEVLFMSGYIEDAIIRRGLLESGAVLLQKPFTVSTLLQKIRSVLDHTNSTSGASS